MSIVYKCPALAMHVYPMLEINVLLLYNHGNNATAAELSSVSNFEREIVTTVTGTQEVRA